MSVHHSPHAKATPPKGNVVLRDDFLSVQKVSEKHENNTLKYFQPVWDSK